MQREVVKSTSRFVAACSPRRLRRMSPMSMLSRTSAISDGRIYLSSTPHITMYLKSSILIAMRLAQRFESATDGEPLQRTNRCGRHFLRLRRRTVRVGEPVLDVTASFQGRHHHAPIARLSETCERADEEVKVVLVLCANCSVNGSAFEVDLIVRRHASSMRSITDLAQ